MARIRIELFGEPSISDAAGLRHPLLSRNARALLAVLAVAGGRPQSRTRLATLIWDAVDLDHARASLRQTLFHLRRTLGDAAFLQSGETLALVPAAVDVDLWDFAALLASGTADALRRATDLYRGDLLESHPCRKGMAFDDWLMLERQRLQGEAVSALGRLLDDALDRDQREAARRTAGRMLALEPAEETAHRALMRIHVGERRFGLALRQFEWCRQALQTQFGVAPDLETRRLHAEIVGHRAVGAAPLRRPQSPSLGLQLAGA